MNRLVSLLGFRSSDKKKEDLKNSIGERRGAVRNGKYTCWEAVGPVREAWSRLGPEIKDYVETSCKYGPALSLEIYMIGRTEEDAAPKILICSADHAARKEVQKAIRRSGIMKNYPAIGLGDTGRLPDLLAKEDIELAVLPISYLGYETVALSSPLDQAFGRRLFIPRRENDSLRLATAGPILYNNNRTYQLTVGHAFSELNIAAPPDSQAPSWDDCEFDGQSDSEDDSSSENPQVKDIADCISKIILDHNIKIHTDNEISSELHSASSQTLEFTSSATNQPLIDPAIDIEVRDQGQIDGVSMPQKLVRVGKLALASETGDKQSLDYALVELEGEFLDGSNELDYAPNTRQRWLRVRQTAKVGPRDVKVVTMTGSEGLLSGKLCSTASYMRLPDQRTLQELYPVHLDGKVNDGDCGAGVVDQLTGDLYGHIVAGKIGTGVAYIVPAEQVFQNILDRLGGDVTLVRPEKSTSSRDRTGQEPLRIVEFASREYFRQLKRPIQSVKEQGNLSEASTSAFLPATSFTLPIGLQMPILNNNQRIHSIGGQFLKLNKQRRPRHPGPVNNFRSRSLTMQSKGPRSNSGWKGKSREETGLPNWTSLTFEDRFFALPSDLHVQIIASLHIPDISNLRMTSRAWHNLVSINEAPIARAFMEDNPIPHYVIQLYPLPDPSKITLNYLFGLWHRFFVASKLSAAMTNWISEDMFLLKKDLERIEFEPHQARMYRRLIPPLFIIFHFFEKYRNLHLKYILKHGHSLPCNAYPINPIELQIMGKYGSEMLLQAHQVFPQLISVLTRKLRPPSHYSRVERSLRGYRTDPPPAHVLVAILSIGGLREVARFLEVEDYELRIEAVDDWYNSILPESLKSDLHARRWLNWPDMWRRKPVSSSRVEITAAALGSANTEAGSGNLAMRHKILTENEMDIIRAALEASSPMGSLQAEIVQLLIPDLPALDNIWVITAEFLLLTKHAVERKHDIKRDGEVMQELIYEGTTSADELFSK